MYESGFDEKIPRSWGRGTKYAPLRGFKTSNIFACSGYPSKKTPEKILFLVKCGNIFEVEKYLPLEKKKKSRN